MLNCSFVSKRVRRIPLMYRSVHLNARASSVQYMDTHQQIFKESFAQSFNEWMNSPLYFELSDILKLQGFEFSICEEADFWDILSLLKLHHITHDNALHIFDPDPNDMTPLIHSDLYNNCYFLGRGIVVKNTINSEICGYYSIIDAADFLYHNSYKYTVSKLTEENNPIKQTLTAKHIAEVVGNVVNLFFSDLKTEHVPHGIYARGSWFTVHQNYRKDTAISFMLRSIVWHLIQSLNYQYRIGIASNRLTTAQSVHQYHPFNKLSEIKTLNYTFSSHTFRDGIDINYYLHRYKEKYDIFGDNSLKILKEKCSLQGFKMPIPMNFDRTDIYKEGMITMANKYIDMKQISNERRQSI